MADIHKFEPKTVSSDHRFDPDEVLETAKGKGFVTMAILGQLPDGTFWVSGNANQGETLILLEYAKHEILFGED